MRNPYFIITLGTNGTGKTTIVNDKYIKFELSKPNGKVLIVTPDDTEWTQLQDIKNLQDLKTFTGTKRLIYQPGYMPVLKEHYKNGLLVFDDFRGMEIEGKKETDALRRILVRRRQKARDIILTVHGFTDIIPSFVIKYATHFVIFKTLDNIKLKKNYFVNYIEMKEAQERINKKAKTNPHYFEIIEINPLTVRSTKF